MRLIDSANAQATDAWLASMLSGEHAAFIAFAFTTPPILLDYNTANFCTDFQPANDGQTTELVCPSSTFLSPRMEGGFAKERTVASSEREAKEESKSDAPCGSYLYGRRQYCRQRTCFTCSSIRHYYMRSNLAEHVKHRPANRIYSLSLTTPPVPGSLRRQLGQLYENFRQLRRRVAWQNIIGGVWFVDLTYNAIAQHWHPHLHLIVESDCLNVSDLQHRWFKLTGGSIYSVPVTNTPADIERLANYDSRPAHLKDDAKGQTFTASPALMIEYVAAVKGKQLHRSFGSWRRLKLLNRQNLWPVRP